VIALLTDSISLQQKGFSPKFGDELLRIIYVARRAAPWSPNPGKPP
jgi:hypothetical protein